MLWLYSSALSCTALPQCWHTVLLADACSSACPGELVRAGDAVLTLNGLASDDECASLVEDALDSAALLQRSRFDQGLPPTGRARLPTLAAMSRADASDLNCMQHLSTRADALCKTILLRALHTIDTQLPTLRSEFVPGEAHSLAHRFEADLLEYSSFEPAVNVYSAGGEFLPHKDHQALTVLVPLSGPDDFIGGGTGFWAKSAEPEPEAEQAAQGWAQGASTTFDVAAPSLVLTPPRGTAMLFAGHVSHAGMAVEGGTRVVLVASFSAKGATARELMRTTEARWEGAAVTRMATPTHPRVNDDQNQRATRRHRQRFSDAEPHLAPMRSPSPTWESPFP